MNRPNKIILHCAASPDKEKPYFTFEKCHSFHTKNRGWLDIGYHFYIERSGEVFKGRPLKMHGAHTRGQNTKSIGICYEGSHFPTVAQIDALCNLYRTFLSTHGFTVEDWHGHREYANKDCPGFDIEDLKMLFKKLA